MEARHNTDTRNNLMDIVIALEQIKARNAGKTIGSEDHQLYTRALNLIKQKSTLIVDNSDPAYNQLQKTIRELKTLKDTEVEKLAAQRDALIIQIRATFDDSELKILEQRQSEKKDRYDAIKAAAELENVPDIFAEDFDPNSLYAPSHNEDEDAVLEVPDKGNILDSELEGWELVGEAKANQLAASNEIKNNETIRVRTNVPEPKQSVFDGWTKNSGKKGGANPPGPYGGVYKDADGNLAMFKRDTYKGAARVGKIIGEYVATNIVAEILNDIHQHDDPDYVRKYVAQVSLVVAKTEDQKPGQHHDDEVYLKSIFIKNNLGDFWEVAHVENSARQLSDADIDKLMPKDIPERESEILKAKAQAKAIRENISLVLPKGQLREIAKQIVKEQYGEEKPAAVLEATFQRYENPKIKVPSDVLKNDAQLRKQFCEQVAARILVSDFGLHHGNFLLLQDEKASDVRRLGTIDLGAAFDEFTPEVKPFSFKQSLLEYYKNHLLEFAPGVIYSKEMAEAFITVGKRQDSFFQVTIEKIISSEKIPYSVEGIRAFCKRLGMDKGSYEKIADKDELLGVIKGFMLNRLVSRSVSLKETGYGLLIENCFKNRILNTDLLRHELEKHPDLNDYIKNNLKDYSTSIVNNSDLSQVKQFFKSYEEDIKKAADNQAKQAALTVKLKTGLEQIEGVYNELITLNLQLNHPLSKNSDKQQSMQTGFDKSIVSTLKFIDDLKKETEANIVASNNEDHKKIYKDILGMQGAIEDLRTAQPNHVSRPAMPIPEAVAMQPVEIEPIVEIAGKPEASVLTLAMLGTNEHRSNKTILTELIDSIDVGPNQFAHLIDGPGGSGGANSDHPMLGTYEFKYDENGIATKVPLGKSETVQQIKGLLKGEGFENAIVEAKQVIKHLIDTGHKPLTLNLAGFSRGADNILRLSNELNAIYTRDELVINIFAIDPVPGPKRQMATRAKIIPELVQDYVAVLQRDESRSIMEVQAKSHLTRQNPSMTTQQYHLYHGPHTAGNYLEDVSAAEALNPEKHHTARLVYDDLSKFVLGHGVKLKDNKKAINHVIYRADKSVPAKPLNDGDRFYRYTNMLAKHQQDTAVNPIVQREFTHHMSDYFLHGQDYFIDTEHMQSFQKRFPNFFDYFFQQGQQFQGDKNRWDNVVADVKEMRVYPQLIETLEAYFQRAGIHNIQLKNLETLKDNRPQPQGIGLIASEYYGDSPLLKLWEAVQSATHPVRIGYDVSAKNDRANALHDKVSKILTVGTMSVNPAAKINAIAQLIQDEIQATNYAPSVFNHKLTGILEYLGKTNAHHAALGPAVHIESELTRLKKESSSRQKFRAHNAIIDRLQASLTEAKQHGLLHDTELMNQLLNTALRSMNTLRQQGDNHARQYEKFFRKLILDISTDIPPMNKSLEQKKQATIIKNKFLEDAGLAIRDLKPAVTAASTVKNDSSAGIEMVEVAPKKAEILEPPPKVNALAMGADLLSALDDLDKTMKNMNAAMKDMVAAMSAPKETKQSRLSNNQASVFYHPSQPEHAAEKTENKEDKRGKYFGKNASDE